MKLIGSYADVEHMINGRGARVTHANVSAVGYIPGAHGTESQFRIATLSTPEAKKKGCLEAYKYGVIERDYMILMHHADIPLDVLCHEFREIGSALLSEGMGGFLLSAFVHQDQDMRCSFLVNYESKNWRHFPLPFVTDFHVNQRGKVAVIVDGCAGFVDPSDLMAEVSRRSLAASDVSNQKAFVLDREERVRVPEGTVLTRYVLREAPEMDTLAVCRNGQVTVYDKHAKLIRRIGDDPEKDLDVIKSERPAGVKRSIVLTDDYGNPHRLDLMEMEESEDEDGPAVLAPRSVGPKTIIAPAKKPKREVRRVRSTVAEADTAIRATPITH